MPIRNQHDSVELDVFLTYQMIRCEFRMAHRYFMAGTQSSEKVRYSWAVDLDGAGSEIWETKGVCQLLPSLLRPPESS